MICKRIIDQQQSETGVKRSYSEAEARFQRKGGGTDLKDLTDLRDILPTTLPGDFWGTWASRE